MGVGSATAIPTMQHIPAESLEDLPTRVQYLIAFIGFTEDDEKFLQASAPVVAPLVPTILDVVYDKLLSFDITAKAFVPRNTDYEGPELAATVSDLHANHPQIMLRRDFLKNYLVKLVTNSDFSAEGKFWDYLDKVGLMHSGKPGFKHRERKPELRVEYIHLGMLLGYVLDVVISSVFAQSLDEATKMGVIRAFNKLLWIQNDLMARHFTTALS